MEAVFNELREKMDYWINDHFTNPDGFYYYITENAYTEQYNQAMEWCKTSPYLLWRINNEVLKCEEEEDESTKYINYPDIIRYDYTDIIDKWCVVDNYELVKPIQL